MKAAYSIICLFLFVVSANAGQFYSNNFDDKPDWDSGRSQSPGLSGTRAEAATIGFSSFRADYGSNYLTPSEGSYYNFYTIGSAYARGGSGKGLQVALERNESEQYVGGGLDIHFGDRYSEIFSPNPDPDGYDDLYLRFYIKFPEDLVMIDGDQWKWVRIYSHSYFRESSCVGANDPADCCDGPTSGTCIDTASGGIGEYAWVIQETLALSTSPSWYKSGYQIVDWAINWGTEPHYYPTWKQEKLTGIAQYSAEASENWETTQWSDSSFGDNLWHCVEFHWHMNDLESANGYVSIYIDDVLFGTSTLKEIRTSSTEVKYNYLGLFDNLNIDGTGEFYIYVDDIVVSTEYIGPDSVSGTTVGGGTGSTTMGIGSGSTTIGD